MSKEITETAIFTDASLYPRLKLGAGACLTIPAALLETPVKDINKPEIINNIKIKKFEQTSSSKLELQTVLWAIETFKEENHSVKNYMLTIYTDSQSVAGLPGREQKLKSKNYMSGKSKRPLKNAELYKKFYKLRAELNFEVVKVKGHSRAGSHDTTHRIFAYLDREARRVLREWMKEH